MINKYEDGAGEEYRHTDQCVKRTTGRVALSRIIAP